MQLQQSKASPMTKAVHLQLQLYYNYYLRTSGLNFLSESYVFYDAIHGKHPY